MREIDEIQYDIALSFTGEDRGYAENLASLLVDKGVRVFYDKYEGAILWGKDLYQHLQKVYKDLCRYCIFFVSESYSQKLWTKHELKQAQARAFQENQEYILPIRIDGTEIPGLNATVGYVDLRSHDLDEIKNLILQKLFGSDFNRDELKELTWKGEMVEAISIKSFVPNWVLEPASHPRQPTVCLRFGSPPACILDQNPFFAIASNQHVFEYCFSFTIGNGLLLNRYGRCCENGRKTRCTEKRL